MKRQAYGDRSLSLYGRNHKHACFRGTQDNAIVVDRSLHNFYIETTANLSVYNIDAFSDFMLH